MHCRAALVYFRSVIHRYIHRDVVSLARQLDTVESRLRAETSGEELPNQVGLVDMPETECLACYLMWESPGHCECGCP